MKTIYFFWNQLNWLEFVTYVLIPTSIVLVILVYLLFNVRIFKLSFDFDISFIEELDKKYEEDLWILKSKLEKYIVTNEDTKEKV